MLTDLIFLCGIASRKIASAHNIPEFGHSCKALAIIDSAMSLIPALNSTRIASNHSWSFFGFFKRARSNTDLAFINKFLFSSNRDNNNHNGIALEHFFICN